MRGGDDACMPCHHIRPASCVLIDVGQLGRPSRPCVCWAVFDLMTMVEWSVTERSMTIMLCESPAYAQNEGSIHTRLRSVSVIMWLYACTVDGLHAMPPLVACFMRVAFAGEVLDLIIGNGPAVRESCMCTKVRRPTHVAERKRARAYRSWLSALTKYAWYQPRLYWLPQCASATSSVVVELVRCLHADDSACRISESLHGGVVVLPP